jgi:beta-1,4-N-acetylglucosaminyltransferase
MIFVTVGSQDFDPLIAKMDELAPQLGVEVVMQIGHGLYEPRKARFFHFAPSLDTYFDQADLIVAHGGLGTIVEALERGKKLICVADPTRYDRHQEQLLTVFSAQGNLLWCKDIALLEEAIRQAAVMHFTPYELPECHIHELVSRYLAGHK